MTTVSVRYITDDVDAAVDFYAQRLGFEVEMHPAPGFAMLSRGDLRLLLNRPGAGGAGQPMPDGRLPEPGGWNPNDKELAGLRSYLLKGGFIIFDDFRDGFRGGGGWDNFVTQMRRVLPDARIVDMNASDPVFHSFFEIPSLNIVPQYYDRGQPEFKGIYEDNDPKKRLIAMINFNTDVSNFWEFSATGYVPISESNEAYKLGVNYIMYGITH